MEVAALQVLRFFWIFERGKSKTQNPSLDLYVSKCDTSLQVDTWELGFMYLVIFFSVLTLEGAIATSEDVQLDTLLLKGAKPSTFQSQLMFLILPLNIVMG